MISFDPPPNGFSTGEYYSAPLRIYLWNNRFWIYDQKGFLCSVDHESYISSLLGHQAKPPTQDAPFGAREFLIPSEFEARLARQAARDEAHTRAFGEPKPFPARSAPKRRLTGLSLKDLGL